MSKLPPAVPLSLTADKITPTAACVGRHLKLFGSALTAPEDFAVTAEELADLQQKFSTMGRDPDADDKRRAFASWVLSKAGSLVALDHFEYVQPGNTQHAGPRNIQAASEDMRNHSIVQAVIRYTLEVGRHLMPELFMEDVRIDYHGIRYEVSGNALSLSSPPFEHSDRERLSHVVLIDRQNVIGGLNYFAVGKRLSNIGVELTDPLTGFLITNNTRHGVSPLLSADGGHGYRDIGLVTLQPLAEASGADRQYD